MSDDERNITRSDGDDSGGSGDGGDDDVSAVPKPLITSSNADDEIEQMKKRVAEMEAEAAKFEAMQKEILDEAKVTTPTTGPDVDERSVYVGNVDYSTTTEELQTFFKPCGVVNRITILCDKITGHPKGFAYVEFKEKASVETALLMNGTDFKNRPLKISPKRTNMPGYRRGRGRRRGGYHYGGYRPRYRRRRAYYQPY